MNLDAAFTTPTFACGHEYQVELFGNAFEMEEQFNYMKSSCKCPECMINQFRKPKLMTFEEAIIDAGNRRLPHLYGKLEEIKQGTINRALVFSLDDKTLWHIFLQEVKTLRAIAPAYDHYMDYRNWEYKINVSILRDLLWGEVCALQHSWWWTSHELSCTRQLCNKIICMLGEKFWD